MAIGKAGKRRSSERLPGAQNGNTPAQSAETKQSTPASEQNSDYLLLDARTGESLAPRAQPGYYPGFSTLRQQAFWDEATRKVVLDRVQHTPPIRFFTPDEAQLMEAVSARIIPQDDRDAAHKIPIVCRIDERLYAGRIDGYRYENMPPDGEAHRLGLRAIEAIAQHLYGVAFVELAPGDQERVLATIHDGKPPAAEDIWRRMSISRYWMLLVQDCIEAYYSHPYAWDEIGFGGPAYPRGYIRLENGLPESWEVNERRYEWRPPSWAVSHDDQPIGGEDHAPTPGQEGTH